MPALLSGVIDAAALTPLGVEAEEDTVEEDACGQDWYPLKPDGLGGTMAGASRTIGFTLGVALLSLKKVGVEVAPVIALN